MKTGILITARLGSTRLKKKHMLAADGRPLLMYLIKRIKKEFSREIESGDVMQIIATSDEQENREFEVFTGEGLAVFYGSLSNIPLRHLQAAEKYLLDNIISIDGDDILCSVKGMRLVYESLNQGHHYVKTSNLPFGMNTFGYSVEFLKTSVKNHHNDVLETGWGRIFDSGKLININIPFPFQNHLLRFTLDYNEDYFFFKTLIEAKGENIYSISDEEIVSYVLNNHLYKVNENISREYWNNFYNKVEEEKQDSLKNIK